MKSGSEQLLAQHRSKSSISAVAISLLALPLSRNVGRPHIYVIDNVCSTSYWWLLTHKEDSCHVRFVSLRLSVRISAN